MIQIEARHGEDDGMGKDSQNSPRAYMPSPQPLLGVGPS